MRTWFLEELPLMYSQSLIIQLGWGGASCPDGGHISRMSGWTWGACDDLPAGRTFGCQWGWWKG